MTAALQVLTAARRPRRTWNRALLGDHPFATVATATALVAATLVTVDPLQNAIAYAVVQAVLVLVAAVDLAERRIPNVAIVGLAALGIGCRAVSDPGRLAVAAIIAAVVLVVAAGISVWSRGGIGMGDAKLAAVLGLVLGTTVYEALLIGTVLGALPGIVLLARGGLRARRATLAYGPYLVLGAAVAILTLHPAALL